MREQPAIEIAFHRGYVINSNGVLVSPKGKCLILPVDRYGNSLLNIQYLWGGQVLRATIKIQDFALYFFQNSLVFKGQPIPIFDWDREAYLSRYYGKSRDCSSLAREQELNAKQEYCYVKINSSDNDVQTIMSQAFGSKTPKNLLLHVVHAMQQNEIQKAFQSGEIHFQMMKYFAHVHSRFNPSTCVVEFMGTNPYHHSGIEMLPLPLEDQFDELEGQEEAGAQIPL